MRTRAAPGSGVTFAEIEVILCNIPSKSELMEEEEEERKEREGKRLLRVTCCYNYVVYMMGVSSNVHG